MMPRRRPPTDLWESLRPTPTLIAVLVGLLAVYVIIVAGARDFAWRHLILIPHLALGPEPWQLVTNGVVHFRFSSLLQSAVGLWLFGTTVEWYVGRTRFLVVLFGSLFAGSLLVALGGRLFFPTWGLAGIEPGVMAMLAAYARLLWDQPMSLFGATRPIRGGAIALVFIAVTVVVNLSEGQFAELTAGLGAAGCAALLVTRWNASSGGMRALVDRMRLWRLRRRYRVISGGRDTKRYLN
jgi:membrane associated rhomboid family serine protease